MSSHNIFDVNINSAADFSRVVGSTVSQRLNVALTPDFQPPRERVSPAQMITLIPTNGGEVQAVFAGSLLQQLQAGEATITGGTNAALELIVNGRTYTAYGEDAENILNLWLESAGYYEFLTKYGYLLSSTGILSLGSSEDEEEQARRMAFIELMKQRFFEGGGA